MIYFTLLIPFIIFKVGSFQLNVTDDEFDLIRPDEEPLEISYSTLESLENAELEINNDQILSKLAVYKERHNVKNQNVRIGRNEYLLLKKLGDGAEGLVYTAKDVNDTIVIVKAILESSDAKESFDNEILVLSKLNRLLDYDKKHFILVETMIEGESMGDILEKYIAENVGANEYPSDHVPLDLKENYLKILWTFRNKTKMAHGDFRPYNVIGGEVIDFGRTEPLSRNLRKRKKQIKSDDETAVAEWDWFFYNADWAKIEEKPLLFNAINRSEEIWDIYLERYDEVKKNKKYRTAWMAVLKQIIETNDTTLKFPTSSQFTND